MIFALVGNQNCGKTTLFNRSNRLQPACGQFSRRNGRSENGRDSRARRGCSGGRSAGHLLPVVPIRRRRSSRATFIINQKPDGIINIVDATNIERNLYLTLQLLELQVPMVLALNMMDEVRANGGTIDVQKMSQALGIPVIPISAANGEGVSELVDQAIATAHGTGAAQGDGLLRRGISRAPLHPRGGSPDLRSCRNSWAFPRASAQPS